MSIETLSLQNENILNFNLTIDSEGEAVDDIRLLIKTPDYDVVLHGNSYDPLTGEVSFVIPSMQNLVNEGSYFIDVEVVIGNNLFKPFSNSIEFQGASISGGTVTFTTTESLTAEDIANAVWSKPRNELTDGATIGGYVSKKVLTFAKFIGFK